MEIKVSVVVPTYKRANLLSKVIEALVAQRFPAAAYEIIVVIDGQDEVSENIVLGFKKENLRFFTLKQNQGPASARNIGWQNAKGELIAFTDDDCVPNPDWVAALWQDYESKGKAVVAYAGKIIVPIDERPTDYEVNTKHLEDAEFVTANCACARLALQMTGGFDEDFRMAWREDSDLHFKLIRRGVPIIHLENAVVIHPVRKAPWGISIKEQKKSMFNALLYKRHPDLYREKIRPLFPWQYFIIVCAFIVFLAGLVTGMKAVMYAGLTVWLLFTSLFIGKRLKETSRSVSHVSEMVVTSLVIPFLSVYWRIYGILKYKSLN